MGGGGGNGAWQEEEVEDIRVHMLREESRVVLGHLSSLAQHTFDFWGLMIPVHSHWILVTNDHSNVSSHGSVSPVGKNCPMAAAFQTEHPATVEQICRWQEGYHPNNRFEK